MQWNGAREPMSTASTHSRREGKSLAAMEKRRKGQVLDGTGSRSLNSACRRLSCVGRLSVDLRQQQHSAALWATKQPSLGTALLAPHGDGPRKSGLNKACLALTRVRETTKETRRQQDGNVFNLRRLLARTKPTEESSLSALSSSSIP